MNNKELIEHEIKTGIDMERLPADFNMTEETEQILLNTINQIPDNMSSFKITVVIHFLTGYFRGINDGINKKLDWDNQK